MRTGQICSFPTVARQQNFIWVAKNGNCWFGEGTSHCSITEGEKLPDRQLSRFYNTLASLPGEGQEGFGYMNLSFPVKSTWNSINHCVLFNHRGGQSLFLANELHSSLGAGVWNVKNVSSTMRALQLEGCEKRCKDFNYPTLPNFWDPLLHLTMATALTEATQKGTFSSFLDLRSQQEPSDCRSPWWTQTTHR